MKQHAMKMLAVGTMLSLAAGATVYDASWMDAYTWTERSERLADSPFVMNTGEGRPLRFTGTDYLTLPSAGNSAPLVFDGNIFLQGGDKLTTARTAIVGGTTHAINNIWVGVAGQIVDVANATVDGESGAKATTASGASGWSVNLYDGALWKLPFHVQNANATVLDPCINVYGGTFAPEAFTRGSETSANCVQKVLVNFFDGATFNGLCTAGSTVVFNVQPGAQVTFQTGTSAREINPKVVLGEGSLTRIVKGNDSGPDNNRYKLMNDTTGISGSGDILITPGSEIDFRPVNAANYTGTVTVEQGAKFQFPGFRGIMSSPDMKVVFRGGTVGESAYSTTDNQLTLYPGRIEIESWIVGPNFTFGDSPATVVLKSGCNFGYDNLSDLALLTGGEAGGQLVLETNTTMNATLPLAADDLPPFFGTRTTFPAEGTMNLVASIAEARDTVYVLGTGYGAEVADAIALTMTGAAANSVDGEIRVVDGVLQLVVSANGSVLSLLGASDKEDGAVKVHWRLDAFGKDATSTAVTFEWSDDADFNTVLGTKDLGEFDTLGEKSFAFPELASPGRFHCRFTAVNSAGAVQVTTAQVGFAKWRPQSEADTWNTESWDVGKEAPEAFSNYLSVQFDGEEEFSPATIAVPNPVKVMDFDVAGANSYVFANAGRISALSLSKKGEGELTLNLVAGEEFALPSSVEIAGGGLAVSAPNNQQGLILGAGALSVSNAVVKALSTGALRIGEVADQSTIELWDGADWTLPIYYNNATAEMFDTAVNVHSGAVFAPAAFGRQNTAVAAYQNRKLTLNLKGGQYWSRINTDTCLAIAAEPGTTSTIKSNTAVTSIFGEFSLPEGATIQVVKSVDTTPAANRVKLEDAHLTGSGRFVVTAGASLDLRPTFAEEFTGTVDVEEGAGFYFPASQAVAAHSNMVVNVNGGYFGTSAYGTTKNYLHYYPGTINISWVQLSGLDNDFNFDASPTRINLVEGGLLSYTNLVDLALFTGGESTGTLNLFKNSTLEVPVNCLPEDLPLFLGTRTTFPETGVATLRIVLGEAAPLWKDYTLGTGYSASVLPHVRAICVGPDNSEWRGSLSVKGDKLVLMPHGGMWIYIR